MVRSFRSNGRRPFEAELAAFARASSIPRVAAILSAERTGLWPSNILFGPRVSRLPMKRRARPSIMWSRDIVPRSMQREDWDRSPRGLARMRIDQARDVGHFLHVRNSVTIAQVLQEFSAIVRARNAGGLQMQTRAESTCCRKARC